ncbi:MAG TPA: type II toxin-antitoxin system PemK/MazF family toxin [Clostridia bacterium]|nr:type II toxin-antitoxin system PemK/MazF family toxin [Clostridia bacterium]
MFKQGDILLVPVPFTDLTSNKRRPVLVISNDDYNKQTQDIIVVAITSNITSKGYTIFLSNENLQEGTLKVNSCIRADKIYTLSQRIVIRKFGCVKDNVINFVKEKIEGLLNNKVSQ